MRMIDPLVMEFDREAATTRRVLERVPDGKLGYKPHEKSMSIGELAYHIATVPQWVAATLRTGFDAADMQKPVAPSTSAEIVKAFDENGAAVKTAMGGLDDTEAMEIWRFTAGGKTVFELPRAAFIRMILLNHSVHHRGQLSVYLRLLDVPVPAIYGPSADENPFA